MFGLAWSEKGLGMVDPTGIVPVSPDVKPGMITIITMGPQEITVTNPRRNKTTSGRNARRVFIGGCVCWHQEMDPFRSHLAWSLCHEKSEWSIVKFLVFKRNERKYNGFCVIDCPINNVLRQNSDGSIFLLRVCPTKNNIVGLRILDGFRTVNWTMLESAFVQFE